MVKPLIGAHFSYKKDSQLLGTVIDAVSIGATSGAFYISNSRGYNKYELNKEIVVEAKKLAEKNNLNLENFIIHSPLIGNLANIDMSTGIFNKTFNSYLSDLKSMKLSGLKYFNFQLGSCSNYNKGINKIAEGINSLHKKTQGDKTIILLETMMAKGNYIGRTFDQLKDIIDLVNDKTRIGICMDTCHVWDAGYDIKNNLDKVLKEFDKVIGIKYLKALHINDSKNDIGSNKDRHECIGKGYIGKESLIKVVNHKLLRNLPKALETPYGNSDFKKWKYEMNILIN